MATPVTIGELFPADDPVARWVFSVTAAATDLGQADSPFVEALPAMGTPAGFVRASYLFRHLIARIYEAERPILALSQRAELQAFVADVDGVAESSTFLLNVFVPPSRDEESLVRSELGLARHLAVHHSRPDSDELRAALVRAESVSARILVSRADGWLRYEWPEAVAVRAMAGATNTEEGHTALNRRVRLARDVVAAFGRLTPPVLWAHCRARGIDPKQLELEVQSS